MATTKKTVPPKGVCTGKIKKCKIHKKYNCADCHQLNKDGLLSSIPSYIDDTEKKCNWTGNKKSIAKHSKRYHGTKSKHTALWKQSIQRASSQTCLSFTILPIQSSNTTTTSTSTLESASTISTSPDLNDCIDLNDYIDLNDCIDSNDCIDLNDCMDSNDFIYSNTSSTTAPSTSPSISIPSNVEIAGFDSNVQSVTNDFKQLQIEENIFDINIPSSPSPGQLSNAKKQTLKDYGFCSASSPTSTATRSPSITSSTATATATATATKRTNYVKTAEELNAFHMLWSKMKHESCFYYFGCHFCPKYDKYKRTIYAENEWARKVHENDIINNTKEWKTARDGHHNHEHTAGHKGAVGVAFNSDIFNKLAIQNQLKVSLGLLRGNKPDTDYKKDLFLVHQTGGFPGNIGHSEQRLNYYTDIIHRYLKGNILKQLSIPRPWGDILKKKRMELEKNKRNFNNKLNKDIFPMLSKYENSLKTFILFEVPLNNKRFIIDNTVNLSEFGDINDIVDIQRNEIIEQLNYTERSTIYCCYEPYDASQNYILCNSNHPLCLQWIHQKCSGLKARQFNTISLSSKSFFCNQCKSYGVKKKLNTKEIEKIITDLQNTSTLTSTSITSTDTSTSTSSNLPSTSTSTTTSNIKPKTTKTTNQNLITSFLAIKHPKPAKSNNNDEQKTNPIYTESERKEAWNHCIDGSISIIKSFEFHLFDKTEGLFRDNYFKTFLPWYMMDIFDVAQWVKLENYTKIINSRSKILVLIKKKLVNKKAHKIKKLWKFIIASKIRSLSLLIDLKYETFKNELILFIYYTLYISTKYTHLREERLIHKALFDAASHSDCQHIKILIDVGWHCQPNENYAETIAKLVGLIFSPNKQKMKFEKLRLRTLGHSWLPPYKYYDNLLRDLVLQATVDGVRGVKRDKRSDPESIAFKNYIESTTLNAVPYK